LLGSTAVPDPLAYPRRSFQELTSTSFEMNFRLGTTYRCAKAKGTKCAVFLGTRSRLQDAAFRLAVDTGRPLARR
jgi:hypothetical protein